MNTAVHNIIRIVALDAQPARPTRPGTSGAATGTTRDPNTNPTPPGPGGDPPATTAISPQPTIFRILLKDTTRVLAHLSEPIAAGPPYGLNRRSGGTAQEFLDQLLHREGLGEGGDG